MENLFVCLLRDGFTVKSLTGSCFDIFARKERPLLIKVLQDANSISTEDADEMKRISSYIDATPVIVCEKAHDKLQDNVAYVRFSIYTLNSHTFRKAIENDLPFVKRTRAGFTIKIIGKNLRNLRENKNMSVNEFARKIGVSGRMVSKYENENAEIILNKAIKVYDLVGGRAFEKIDIFFTKTEPINVIDSDVGKKYNQLGFMASETKKAPFDIISRKDREIILTDVRDKQHKGFSSMSKLLDAQNLVIFKRKKPKDIPSLKKKEFMQLKKSNELINFLKEF